MLTPAVGSIPGVSLSKNTNWRIAIIGAPETGKTTSCLTFPNRIWANFDNKLCAGEQEIPFWNSAFCDSLVTRTAVGTPANKRDAFNKWLKLHGTKLTPEDTFIVDSSTILEGSCDQQTMLEEQLSTGDKNFDMRKFYGWKLHYAVGRMDLLKSLNCRLVITFHETQERDKEGNLTGRIKPLQTGSFQNELLGHFTDVWRMLARPSKRNEKGELVLDRFSKPIRDDGYYWQIAGNEKINCLTNPTIDRKGLLRVKADYNEILKLVKV